MSVSPTVSPEPIGPTSTLTTPLTMRGAGALGSSWPRRNSRRAGTATRRPHPARRSALDWRRSEGTRCSDRRRPTTRWLVAVIPRSLTPMHRRDERRGVIGRVGVGHLVRNRCRIGQASSPAQLEGSPRWSSSPSRRLQRRKRQGDDAGASKAGVTSWSELAETNCDAAREACRSRRRRSASLGPAFVTVTM